MRCMITGLVLATIATAAAAQDSKWGFYEPGDGTMQAGVVATSGEQLIVKCDKPGKRSVLAVVVSNVSIAPPLPDNRWQTRPVTVRIDQEPPFDAAWRYNDKFAMAVDRGNERSMTRFVQTVSNASEVQFTLQPLEQSPSVISFQVAGARDAIERVYKACKDDLPS